MPLKKQFCLQLSFRFFFNRLLCFSPVPYTLGKATPGIALKGLILALLYCSLCGAIIPDNYANAASSSFEDCSEDSLVPSISVSPMLPDDSDKPEPKPFVCGMPYAKRARVADVPVMLGQMLLVGFRGDGVTNSADFDAILKFVSEGKAGGVILFSRDLGTGGKRNIITPEQVKTMNARLQKAAPGMLFISIDQEGGRVQRMAPFAGGAWPSPKEMSTLTSEGITAIAQKMGAELAEVGINLNFAPTLDVDVNPNNPIIGQLGRSFGDNPMVVAKNAASFAYGLLSAGVLPGYKHFPGHGSSGTDSHDGLTDITESWGRMELVPFRVLQHRIDASMVMVGHLMQRKLDARYPASLSAAIINELLRGELGWNGVVISDDLQMKAITAHYTLEETILLCINSGTDILLFGNNIDFDPELPEKVYMTMLKLYQEGKVSKQRIAASYDRIMRLKEMSRALNDNYDENAEEQ